MPKLPTEFRRLGEKALFVKWSDGEEATIPSTTLRLNCPCATCKEKRGDTSHQKPLTGAKSSLRIVSSSSEEETKLLKIWPIGNYALGLQWGDGHNSGIYTYALIEELGNYSPTSPAAT
jgi:DUF971 family protein